LRSGQAAELDGRVVARGFETEARTLIFVCLVHGDVEAALDQLVRGGETGDAGTEHGDRGSLLA
jgi:hypothetical protein